MFVFRHIKTNREFNGERFETPEGSAVIMEISTIDNRYAH